MEDEPQNQTNNEQNHEINTISAFKSMLEVEDEHKKLLFFLTPSNPPTISSFNSLNETFDLGCGNGYSNGVLPGFCDLGSQPQIGGSNLGSQDGARVEEGEFANWEEVEEPLSSNGRRRHRRTVEEEPSTMEISEN
ncbi:hypothetical protein E3N88_13980 [Mikania micrantha]|uniref:Uncharacterized protein n=1 Tax=Mikania micrantha TaxID=192012 RepID=A0A5N6P029_9ASTR|nr:hypothetical protein E3N88_13980 [Mikania micrantha]